MQQSVFQDNNKYTREMKIFLKFSLHGILISDDLILIFKYLH